MALIFYPNIDDHLTKGSLIERMDILMDAAYTYKSVVLDDKHAKPVNSSETDKVKLSVPRDLIAAFNWEEIARVLREIRELPEGSKADKLKKSELLAKLAEIYEVLRTAKLSKLEAVRLALMSEANQLRGGTQVA